MSDSSYAAVTKQRRPLSTTGRPHNLDVIDDAWAADRLSDDEIDAERHEAAIAPLLLDEEGEDDVEALVSTGHSGSAANGAVERRRREEGRWNDLGLDHFDNGNSGGVGGGAGSGGGSGAQGSQVPDANGQQH